MKALRVVLRLGLLSGLGIALAGSPARAQSTSSKETQSPAPGLRKLAGDDAKRANDLDKAIGAALKADRWDDAISRAEELHALRARVQGPKHFETVSEEWREKTLRRLAPMPHEDRVAYVSAGSLSAQGGVLYAQGKYAQAQRLLEKALEIRRRLLTDDHPDTAIIYNNVARIIGAQGKYAQAQPLFEKALEIRRRLLTDEHPTTARGYDNLAGNLSAQGKYLEARDQWLRGVKSLDSARLAAAFTGLERAGTRQFTRAALAAVLARLGQPAEAWQRLEEDLGRGLLDELAARDQRLKPGERASLRELIAELERLDKLVESTPKNLDQAERARRFEDLKRQRALASIALGEFQTKLVADYGPLAGQVATLNEIQAALPADTALVAWVDIKPTGPLAGLQRHCAPQEGRPQGRCRWRQADCRRGVARRPVAPARTGAGKAGRGDRRPAGAGGDRRESSDRQIARGSAVR
jgi:tetratricopeptide (TPR) repeat protein